MSGQGDEITNGEVLAHLEVQDTRVRTRSRKALDDATKEKHHEINILFERLKQSIQVARELSKESCCDDALRDLVDTSREFGTKLEELLNMYARDKNRDSRDVEALLASEFLVLDQAYRAIRDVKNLQTSKLLETGSRISRHSRRSKSVSSAGSSSSSSAVRMRALAEAAVARESAEYERLVADKEHERKTREAELARIREQEHAQHERAMAIIAANKKVAIADARLKAIEQVIEEEGTGEKIEVIDVPKAKSEERTSNWVHLTMAPPEDPRPTQLQTTLGRELSQIPIKGLHAIDTPNISKAQNTPGRHLTTSTPISITGNELIETLTSANQKIVAGLARQNLPKCHPDTFGGDPTLFHPWKTAFESMMIDVDVSPIQEINYLRSFTTGEAQKLVDNYRKRKHRDPSGLLTSLWAELERRFGSAAAISSALLERLEQTAAFGEKENTKLQEFSDLCTDVESQLICLPGLACLNYPNAIQPIAEKLPSSLRQQWEKEIAKYSEENGNEYPGFSIFAKLIQKQSRIKNNPNILAGSKHAPASPPDPPGRRMRNRRTFKTETRLMPAEKEELPPGSKKAQAKRCPFHEREGHSLEECKAFGVMTLREKTEWIMKARLCFRCLGEGHRASSCKESVECAICKDHRHLALLHRENQGKPDGGDKTVGAKCTSTCNVPEGGVSCSKLLLVDVYSKQKPNKSHRIYAIIDEQSNSSLISSELADDLGAAGAEEKYYLTTCSGEKETKYGRRVTGMKIQSLSGTEFNLPTLIECDSIPRDKREIPTPDMARRFPHLQEIANELPPFDKTAQIHLLVGRDAPELLKVREVKNGPEGAPWAQKLSLGWTVIGQMCLDLVGGPAHVLVRQTSLFASDEKRTEHEQYELIPCPNQLRIKENYSKPTPNLKDDVFHTTGEDDDVSLSCEDRKFLSIMETGVHKNDQGNWEMPLPFRRESPRMPSNRSQAANRLNGLIRNLRRKPKMEAHYIEFMQKILDKGHASPVPPTEIDTKSDQVWYLPHFGIYHPKKPEQIRVVFDSSAECGGTSLNKELLAGPDMMNSLLGVLIRVRRETTAVMCDIEQMFHSFYVNPDHRDFLRFLWFEDNNPGKPIAEYRMNVHLFGNGPSPAVATFGLRKTAVDGEEKFGKEPVEFVHRNFYVDDGLTSQPTPEQAIALVTTTREMLATANLRLHKIVSNSVEVMEAFPTEDRGKGVRDLDLHRDILPAQRSLGVHWNLEEDTFTFQVSSPDKPFTRRGVLSVVNSIYDPLGLAVPVLLEGRLLLQRLVIMGKKKNNNAPLGWDDPLPDSLQSQWQNWQASLLNLEKLSAPRCYHPAGFGTTARREIHAFSDASKDAIGTAVYLSQTNEKGETCTALIYGQSKVAPAQVTSIPRLELCAAVLAARAVDKVIKEIDMKIDEVTYYTDSKVVLGYIQNESRRFYVYVANRVQTIRNISSPNRWRYVDTKDNPADLATRCISAKKLATSNWLTGPSFIKDAPTKMEEEQEEIVLNEDDPEVRKEASTYVISTTQRQGLGAERFPRFSTLSSLQYAIANLIVVVKTFKERKARIRPEEKGEQRLRSQTTSGRGLRSPTTQELQQAMTVIIIATQRDSINKEPNRQHYTYATTKNDSRKAIQERKRALKRSPLYRLDPFLDDQGILRVGGRLRRANLAYQEKHPALLPKGHHVADLIVRHFHGKVHHQGRQITHGAVRQAGYWLIGGHRTVAKELGKCVTCKKSRGPILEQRMADLPVDRMEVAPPFTNVGFDVFGPWTVHTRKTRGRAADSKRWGVVFTCLSSRAIHIEVLESMDTSSFICALRRFFALRGPASLLRCDRGTNFVGAKSELHNALEEMDQHRVEKYVRDQECEWLFNPPHASHFGGAWERQIGTIRRVLDAMFAELGSTQITHELLVTLMAEVTAIVNARPIATMPNDVDEPQPLSPSILLTMKTRPLGPPPGNFTPTDLYARRRWRRVQYLADQFWTRWRREYLQNMQTRSKWKDSKRNLSNGDVVLVREEGAYRNDWPMGRISEAINSEDGRVRKAEVVIAKGGKKKTFLRPIKDLVLLIPVAPDQQTKD